MRIRYLSDLHLEFGEVPEALPSIGEDVLVLAGDIHTGLEGLRWVRNVGRDRPVIYVMGNHEYYGHNYDDLLDRARHYVAGTDVTLLEDSSEVIQGVRFIGATLWTDFCLLGANRRGESLAWADQCMNDFSQIRRGPDSFRRKLRPAETEFFHSQSRASLRREIAASVEPVVVVTHHGPFADASAEKYRGDPLSPAFNSDLTAMMQEPVKAWIFGHTHHCVETRIGSTLVVSNQRGYPHEKLPGFAWDRCIEVFPDHSKEAHS